MQRFSLVLATIHRVIEVGEFIQSLESQTYKNFELIIVDQNQDGRLDSIVQTYSKKLKIKHVKISASGLSNARNIGLEHTEFEIIAFPDDDCKYKPNTLALVVAQFQINPSLSLIAGQLTEIDEGMEVYNDKNFFFSLSSKKSCEINRYNFFDLCCSITIFFSRSAIRDLKFDLTLGVGTQFGSGEESDFVYKVLRKKYESRFIPEIKIYHPPIASDFNDSALARAQYYGLGMGAFFKKNLIENPDFYLIPYFFQYMFARPVISLAISAMQRKKNKSLYYINTLKGRWTGLFTYKY